MITASRTLLGQFADDGLVLGLGTKQTVIDFEDSDRLIATIHWFLTPRSEQEVAAAIDSGQLLSEDLEKLIELQALRKMSDQTQNPYDGIYQKTALYYDVVFGNGQAVLDAFSDYTFYVVGAGGIGNFMGYALAMHPVAGLFITDFDTVEESNLNRQFLFTLDDIGEYKAKLLAERLGKRNPNIEVTYSIAGGDAASLDSALSAGTGKKFAIISADSDGLLAEITPVLVKNNTPFLNVGYLNDISTIGPLWAPGHACPLCGNTLTLVSPQKLTESSRMLSEINTNYSAPSALANNAVASSMAMLDVAAFVSSHLSSVQSFDKRLGVANATWERLELPLVHDDGCRYCGCSVAF